ncbi:MAG: hypothetical protein HGB28_04915 [Oscillochloris sp.]|nr:hypothetical protein [Oscillochloris sp.]
MPNWQDVCWDHGASDAAIAALGRAASEIDRMAGERARVALAVLGEWRGEHRERFNERLRQADTADASLAGDLRRASQEVARLSQQAREEQSRRERERAAWEEEQDNNRRAQERAASPGAI